MSHIDLVIFDCDGVLVDSEIIAAQVEAATYAQIGFEIDPMDFAERFAGLTTQETIKHIEEELDRGLPESIADDIEIALNERLEQEVQMIEGVDTMLDQLDYPRCICSNSRGDRLTMMLRKTSLYDRFRPYIFSSREVGDKEPKPSPSVFYFAAAELSVDPRRTVVIEDSTHGVQGAQAAGMRVVGYTGASHSYSGHAESLMDAGAETTVRRMKDLPAVIDAMAGWSGLL